MQVVVILVMTILIGLVSYMVFLLCYDPITRARANNYQQHTDEVRRKFLFDVHRCLL